MSNLLPPKILALLSSLAVSLGVALVPVKRAQAAVFKLTIDELSGSGEIGFDDESLRGLIQPGSEGEIVVPGSALINPYFTWSFSSAEATITQSCFGYCYGFEEYIKSTSWTLSSSDFLDSELSAFNNAEFIFNQGKLVGINNYFFEKEGNGMAYGLLLNGSSGGVWYFEPIFHDEYLDFSIYFGYSIIIELDKNNLKLNFSTIVPWQDPDAPSTEIPEPNLLAGLGILGFGILLKNRIASLVNK